MINSAWFSALTATDYSLLKYPSQGPSNFNFRDPPQVALSLLSIIEIEKRDVKTLGIELALISNPVESVDLQ